MPKDRTRFRGRRLLNLLLLVAVAGFGLLIVPESASADVVCVQRNESTGTCTLEVNVGGNQGNGSRNADSGRDGGGGGSNKPCTFGGKTIPCSSDKGTWYAGYDCYVRALRNQPPKNAAIWGGNTEGAVYQCAGPNGAAELVWLPQAPAGVLPPPDPEVLARRAIAAMNLHSIRIGIVPESKAGSVGLIGMPTWMWVADPGPSTTGPITRSVSERGFSVTATATMERIVWSMGDGKSVTCHGRGTPYRDAFGKRSSPTCGHTYVEDGRYNVSATSYWVVEWEGIGESGEIPLDFTETAAITMGEAQVIVR